MTKTELLEKVKQAEEERKQKMPTEQDAVNAMYEAFYRLEELGWKSVTYCPKDGSTFLAIEPGSTGIHECTYLGQWPDGACFSADGEWPMKPCLFKLIQG
jgi:hypothetical protein